MTPTGTADTSSTRSRRARWIGLAFVLVLAGALVVQLVVHDEPATAPPMSSPAPVEVEATSVYQFATLDEMVAASDAIVVGTVVATEPGRLVGDPDDGGVISRLVTIEVADDLRGGGGRTVVVEEEGSLPDGTPIIVNGVAPSAVGDHGIWFLDTLEGGDVPAFLVINSQGRFLDRDGVLTGGDRRDPLVLELEGLGLDGLVGGVEAVLASG